jgi:hypothetical protein
MPIEPMAPAQPKEAEQGFTVSALLLRHVGFSLVREHDLTSLPMVRSPVVQEEETAPLREGCS